MGYLIRSLPLITPDREHVRALDLAVHIADFCRMKIGSIMAPSPLTVCKLFIAYVVAYLFSKVSILLTAPHGQHTVVN